ncbi:hypothetical protein E2542_SST13170 [Spatholobus suberectus]|nr:hypothetical protein E2542_SST13170 [Spatholobus suberectus]
MRSGISLEVKDSDAQFQVNGKMKVKFMVHEQALPIFVCSLFGFEMEFGDRFRQQAQRPKHDCLLFDLDDTLYPLRSGLAKACLQNIKDYMVEKLGIDPSKIDDLSNLLYKNYGTTMAGLRAIGYDFDYDEYHSFVHGRLPYENLKPDPVLRNLLLSLPYRKLIFTNADKVHASKALNRLGLEDCFEGIICFETLNPIHKSTVSDDEDDIEFVGSRSTNPRTSNGSGTSQIFDIIEHFAQPNPSAALPKTPVICKPSENATELALKIANLNPQRTVRKSPFRLWDDVRLKYSFALSSYFWLQFCLLSLKSFILIS